MVSIRHLAICFVVWWIVGELAPGARCAERLSFRVTDEPTGSGGTVAASGPSAERDGDCEAWRCRTDPEVRAGFPDCIARWAISMPACRYVGFYVGGGAPPRLGECRQDGEGTWGVDYVGWIVPRRVASSWWHGAFHQGGTGKYQSDGPHFVHALHALHH